MFTYLKRTLYTHYTSVTLFMKWSNCWYCIGNKSYILRISHWIILLYFWWEFYSVSQIHNILFYVNKDFRRKSTIKYCYYQNLKKKCFIILIFLPWITALLSLIWKHYVIHIMWSYKSCRFSRCINVTAHTNHANTACKHRARLYSTNLYIYIIVQAIGRSIYRYKSK